MIDFSHITQSFDLPIMAVLQGSESIYFDRLMLCFTSTWTWVPLFLALLYMVVRNTNGGQQMTLLIILLFASGLLGGMIVDELVKPTVMRWRPTRDPEISLLVDAVGNYRGGRFGFFSSHATNTFGLALFISLVVKHKGFTALMVIWSLINCYTRIYLGVHYPSDIVVGLIFATILSLTLYSIYYHVMSKHIKPSYSTRYTSTGFAVSDVYIVIVVTLLCLVYGFFRAL